MAPTSRSLVEGAWLKALRMESLNKLAAVTSRAPPIGPIICFWLRLHQATDGHPLR
jgi:hypothetical protein